MSQISFFALGGLDERGKNCFVLEINDSLYIFDAGVTTPSFSKFGIKKIMFDYTWLESNLNRVKGLFIGIANTNNSGSLQFLNYLFKNVPIYTSKVNKIILEALFNERSMQKVKDFKPYKVIQVEPMKPFSVNGVEITAFQISAISPETIGFCIKTDQGYITVIDEFILSPEENWAFQSQIESINTITKNNNLLLISAVGIVSDNLGYTAPNHIPDDFLIKQVRKSTGRLIVGAFDSNIYLMIRLINICNKFNVPIFINSSVYVSIFRKLEELKIINKNPTILNINDIKEMKKGVVLVIGSQNKLFENLSEILEGQSKTIVNQDDDRYLLCVKTVPGFEYIEAKLFDKIAFLNYDWLRLPKTILDARPSLNDHLYLLSVLKPKYIIPVKGLHFHFAEYEQAASSVALQAKFISLDNGQKVSFEKGSLITRKPEFLNIQEKFVGSFGLNNVEEMILMERQLMSENGVVLLNAVFKYENNQASLVDMKLECIGLSPYDDNSKESYDKMEQKIKTILVELYSKNNKDLKNTIKKHIGNYFNRNFMKTPIVLPSIINLSMKDKKDTN